jgi:hypothetical protein
MDRWTILGGLVVAAGLCACAGSPEPVDRQRWCAQYFDPYPLNEPAPSITEVRPPDFRNPPAEPVRAQWQPTWGACCQTPAAGQSAATLPPPGTMLPGTVAPGTVIPGTLAPGTLAPGAVAPQTVR